MVDDERDLMQRIAGAAVHIDPALTDRDVERLVASARRRRQQRDRLRRAVLAAGLTACVSIAALWIGLHRVRPAPPADMAAATERLPPPPVQPMVHLTDGSTAVPLDADTEIELLEERPERVALSLMRGRAQFRVAPQPRRSFLVHAGDVRVTVVGTVFTVERVADRVGVTVQRGTVRVDWDGGSGLVHAGQSGWYPPLVTMPPAPRPRRSKPERLASAHAEKQDQAADLLLSADLARLAGHPEQGAALLRKLLSEHPDDPTSPVAAFTLGRLLLMELKRPAEAAAAFAQARRLEPNGPFAEDALAREVEALSQAGQTADAHALAEDYRRLYPKGRRTATVKAAGRLE